MSGTLEENESESDIHRKGEKTTIYCKKCNE